MKYTVRAHTLQTVFAYSLEFSIQYNQKVAMQNGVLKQVQDPSVYSTHHKIHRFLCRIAIRAEIHLVI